MQKGHLDQIEGLRGYLAIWVALGHGLQLAGYLSLPGPFGLLLRGDAAVELFMIISGFVITHLVLRQNETYPQYITRRFFRLYPAYAISCVIGFLILSLWAQVVHQVPWQNIGGWAEYMESVDRIAYQTYSNTAPHLILHASMLHGLVPNELLERSAMTFLPAAWSLSLEWQFYLVAPFVIAARGRDLRLAAILVFFIVCFILYKRGTLGTYPINSTIFAVSGYFLIGIVSRLLYTRLAGARFPTIVAMLLAIFVAVAFFDDYLAAVIWAIVYMQLIGGGDQSFLNRMFMHLTTNRYSLLLGKVSYSIYLIHRPVQIVLAYAAVQLLEISRPQMLVVQGAAIVLAIPLAYAMYRLVEAPGIEVGRRLSRMARPANVPVP